MLSFCVLGSGSRGNSTFVAEGVATETVIATSGPGTAEITVTDSSGHVVGTYKRPVDAGLTSVTWDGLDEDGNAVPDGEYTISVEVTNSGNDLPFTQGQNLYLYRRLREWWWCIGWY